jgi:hypothetical protein
MSIYSDDILLCFSVKFAHDIFDQGRGNAFRWETKESK